jgi:protein-disulfide isomerase
VFGVLLVVSVFTNGFNISGSVVESQGNRDNIQPIQPTQPSQPTNPNPSPPTVAVDDDGDPFIGGADAPVEIIEFSDFQCPFCARVVPTVKQIIDTYGDSVKIVFRDFPLSFHQNAQKSAEAAQCAHDQGKFWEYHDLLFANQNSLDTDSLKRYASELGLNTNQFDQCLDSGKYTQEVQEDFRDGQQAGVRGTPTFFINGQAVVGAKPFSEFKRVIDQELGG